MSGLGTDPLDSALIRLRVGTRILGAGFLVAPGVIATCAHVLDGETPVADFPMLRSHDHAVDVLERDDELDIAILRLTDPPPGALPGPTRITGDVRDHRCRAFGYPHDQPDGIWVTGRLVGAQGTGRIQMAQDPDHWHIEPGFSGAPVWDEELAGVVGMVATVTARNDATAHLVPMTALGEAWTTLARNPYRGLQPFEEEHAYWFRGRESLTERLLDLVDKRAVVVVTGPSGSGKSSLVRAGLIPAVRPRDMDVAVFRTLSGEPPLTSLARALLPVLEPELGEQALLTEAESLAARLSTAREETLPWLADRLLAKAEPSGLLVVVDQFEEISSERPHQAREMFELLEDLAGVAPRQRDGRPALAVVVTLRSGALDNLVTDRTADSVADGVVFVPPMTREQLAEAISPDGLVAFEPGLVERILDDAGTEPGTLPLVEFAMARLWERCGAGMLTHLAYDELGGVAGALAGFAEGLYGRLTTTEQAGARRLLIAMARPDENGGFLRRPLRCSEVDDGLLPVLGRLATARLIVVGRTADSTEIVELAHQALLDRWPQLVDWLAEEWEFLTWREQLRAGLDRWLADGLDPGGLLGGAALVRAENWLASDVDLSDEERGYVRASQARERRRLRVLRAVIAVISVLALVAGGLAVWAATANQQAQRQLRIAHSRALAEDSMRLRTIDARMALQLAQAAWHTAPTPEAYGALLTQYAGLQPVEKLLQNLWQGNLDRIMTSPDGSTAAIVNDDGMPSTWAGLNGDNPRQDMAGPPAHRLTGGTFQLSPSGKLLAYDNGAGKVALRNIEHHSPAVMLRDTAEAARVVKSMAFSPDETRLLIKRGLGRGNEEYELWDLVQHKMIPIAKRLGPQNINTESAYLGPTPNTISVGGFGGSVHIYDMVTAEEVRSIPNPLSDGHIAQNGAVVAQCEEITNPNWGTLRVIDITTGAVLRTVPVPNCEGFDLDTSTNYALVPKFSPDNTGGNSQLTIVELDTGETYRIVTPPLLHEPITDPYNNKIAVFAGHDGHPVMLIGNKNLLYRQHPSKSDQRVGEWSESRLISPQGDLSITFDGTMKLNDLRSGATLATVHEPLCWWPCRPGRQIGFTSDGKRLMAIQDDTLVIYSVPTLTVEARIELPLPRELGGPPTDDSEAWSGSVASLDDNQVTVLYAGMITRWNPTDGTPIGTPTQVRNERDGLHRSALGAVLEPRPQHSEQAVVVEPNGDVELWNLDQHQITAHLGKAEESQGSVQFTSDGSTAGVLTPDGNIQLWDVDSEHKRGRPIPSGRSLLGFTPDGQLIVIKSAEHEPGTAEIWDQNSGKRLAVFTWPAEVLNWGLEGTRLILFGTDDIQTLDLDPKLWFDTLCKHNNRDFTDDERAVLAQLGAPDELPCG